MTPPPRAEAAILAPLSPTLQPAPDDWPDFDLHNARAFRPEHPETLVSLFVAHENYPLIVIGDVQLSNVEASHAHRIRATGMRTATVELDVRTFAYGQYDDGQGTIAVWAAGQAGWYTLKPSRGYREIFRQMEEGVRMLYAVADVYRPRRKGKRKEAPWTAEECFEQVGQRCGVDAETARERVVRSADFLFASMIAGKEGVEWVPRNPVFVYLREKLPELYEEVLRRQAAPVKSRKGRSAGAASSDLGSTTSSLKRKRAKPVAEQADVMSLRSSTTTAPSSAKPSDTPQTSQPKSTRKRRTRHSQASRPLGSDDPLPTSAPAAPPAYGTSDSESSSSPGPGTAARRGKSALRLKPSTKGKAPARLSVSKEHPDSEDDLARSPSGQEKEGDRPSPPRRKSNVMDEGIGIPSNSPPSPPASNPDDVVAGAEDIDANHLRHEPDPVQEDTWTCALAGCNHKVYFASRPDSQKLMKEHYILHAYDDDERVQLVDRLKHSSLPVSHLMEKVRLQARAEGLGEEQKKGRVWGDLTGSRFGRGNVLVSGGVGVGVVQKY